MKTPPGVHPTAIVDPSAVLGDDVRIGPGTLIGPEVRIGSGSEIGSHVVIEQKTTLGEQCRIHHGAVLGTDPQHLKFEGEETWLRVGNRTQVREYATLNRGTSWSGETVVGDDCLIMAYAHVAHDCHLGNHVILTNATQLAGHVTVGDWAILSGLVAVHQFVRIGRHALIGGLSRVSQDVVPFSRVSGNPPKIFGINSLGLERRGFSREVRSGLKRAYQTLFHSDLNLSAAVARVKEEMSMEGEVGELIQFIEGSKRGVTF
jgi:UDP-N-acetylglucosamine acyltransferase